MKTFTLNDAVQTKDGSFAEFVRYLPDGNAIVRLGYDSIVVDPATLRKAA